MFERQGFQPAAPFPSKQRWNSLQEELRFGGLMLGSGENSAAGVVALLAENPDRREGDEYAVSPIGETGFC